MTDRLLSCAMKIAIIAVCLTAIVVAWRHA